MLFPFPPRIEKILKIFSDPYIKDQNTLAIFVVGSYANAEPNVTSDLDVFVILKDGMERKRGNTWIGGLEVEYFINPVRQVFAYLDEEDPIRPVTAHMLHSGYVFYYNDPEKILDPLLEKVKEIISTPPPKLPDFKIELHKYAIDDLMKDLTDLITSEPKSGNQSHKSVSYHLLATSLVQTCKDIFFQINQVIQEKVKRIENQIQSQDPVFYTLLQNVIQNCYAYSDLISLAEYTETLLGGKRSKEWILQSKCTF